MLVIGIDIGGTGIKGAVITEDGTLLEELKIATNIEEGREGILRSMFYVIDSLQEKHQDIAGIGVGTAGRVNVKSGEIVFATANLPLWQGTNVKKEMEARYAIPCSVENDANAALVGELWRGTAGGHQSAVMLTLGTGVGGATVINGAIIHGHHFQSGEWGHVVLVPDGKPCNCGKNGCIEQYLSGTALTQSVRNETDFSFIHGNEIFEAYSSGNKQVKQVVDRYIDRLALTLYNITISIDPETILIGGGVIDSKEHWWSKLQAKLNDYRVNTSVVPAALGNKAGMYGSAKLILDAIGKRGESH